MKHGRFRRTAAVSSVGPCRRGGRWWRLKLPCPGGMGLWTLFGGLLFVAPGCRIPGSHIRTEEAVHSESDIALTGEQLRLHVRALVDPLCGRIEAAADRIIAESTEPTVRRHALIWKIDAVPTLRQALFQPEPLVGLMDAWVLSFQMEQFFDQGPGRELLGEYREQAVSACRELEEELARWAAAVTHSGDVSEARAFARQWAVEHPITDAISGRTSTLSRSTERDLPDSFGTLEAVGNLTLTVDDLNRRLEVYSDQVVRQARWEAQLLLATVAEEYRLDEALPLAERAVKSAEMATETVQRLAPHADEAVRVAERAAKSAETAAGAVERLAPQAERTLRVAEGAPTIIAEERQATIRAIQDELNSTLRVLHDERLGAVKDLHQAISDERKTLTRDVEVLSFRLVDHAFWRVAQLCAALLGALVLLAVPGCLVVRRIFVKKRVGSRPTGQSAPGESVA